MSSSSAVASCGLLAEIAAGLATGSDLRTLLEQFLGPIVRLAGARAGQALVLSEAGDQFERVAAVGPVGEPCTPGTTVSRHCGHCGQAASDSRVVWTDALRHCTRQPGTRHMLVLPMQHRGRTLGVCQLFMGEAAEPVGEVRVLLEMVGELLGLALNNARLEQQTLRNRLLQERQAMAAEVHDSLAQLLAVAKMRMPLLHDAIRAHDDARAEAYHDDVRRALSQAHAGLRSIITHLRVPPDPRGLLVALGDCAEGFRRSSGAELDFVNDWPAVQLAPEQESQVLHIVQEALANIARHAHAQHARLVLARKDDRLVQVLVEDDGDGLAPGADGGAHYGLQIMQERARRLGGSLSVGARPGGGTQVRLDFPLPDPAAEGA